MGGAAALVTTRHLHATNQPLDAGAVKPVTPATSPGGPADATGHCHTPLRCPWGRAAAEPRNAGAAINR